MGITLDEVIDNALLDDDVIEALPNDGECWCGTELEFSDNLTYVYCPDRYCFLKVAGRLEAMAKLMSVDGWGESTCRDICKAYKIKSPYSVFLLEGVQDTGIVSAFTKKVNAICDRSKRSIRLWEMVQYGGLPGISSIAFKIFGEFRTIDEAYEVIEREQVAFIAEKLGHTNKEDGVMAVNIYNTLIEYKDELRYGETVFNIIQPSEDEEQVYVAITHSVNGFTNKSAFIKYLNERYIGKASFVLMSSVTHQTEYLVADGDTGSRKYKQAEKYNSEAEMKARMSGQSTYKAIGIGTSQEVVQMLDERFND